MGDAGLREGSAKADSKALLLTTVLD